MNVSRPSGWITGPSDDGRYTGRAEGRRVTLRVARRGRLVRDFRVNIAALCIGPTVEQNRIAVLVAPVRRAQVAPDGRFYTFARVGRGTLVELRGRLRRGRVTGGAGGREPLDLHRQRSLQRSPRGRLTLGGGRVVEIAPVPYETILYDVRGDGVATVTLDSPANRNALTDELLSELIGAFDSAREDERVRCVVLTSSHETVFSAGGSLDQFAAETPIAHKHLGAARFPRLFTTIMGLGKPTICAATGHVLGGALGLALCCDLVVAREGARFGTPEINVGVFPFMIMALIYRNVPRKKTNELLLLGEQISAEEARDAGVVNRVVGAEDFDAAVDEWAVALARKSPLLMRLGKEAMYRQLDMPFEDALDFLRAQLSLAFSTEDMREGVSAFFEKREPNWTGR